MMRSTILKNTLLLFCLWFAVKVSQAVPVETSVVVEIDTIEMGEEKVENIISEPIEILLGALDDVFMVSAKYFPSKAVINVDFSQAAATVENDALVARVKATIDSYMDKLPQRIESISVSLSDAGPKEQLDTDGELGTDRSKTNRNKSAVSDPSESDTTPETTDSALEDAPSIESKPGVVRPVGKRTMVGRYLGSIESSNEFLPVITTLIPVGIVTDSVAAGTYFMSEQDRIVTGEITDCFNNTDIVLTCRWRDQYGTGGVDFIFTPDYKAFNGRWSIGGKEGAYKWSGLKVEDK